MCSQLKESTATEYRHQILDQEGKKCRKISIVINEKNKNKNNNNNKSAIGKKKEEKEEKCGENAHQFFASTPAPIYCLKEHPRSR